ncbi:hypothetical protein BACFIN_08518 [Bacteroides finegoldii DSM 17565]|nr:hypothetical protein BACFIN_08518 [Bacteroides finegoldii DSM 17565]
MDTELIADMLFPVKILPIFSFELCPLLNVFNSWYGDKADTITIVTMLLFIR